MKKLGLGGLLWGHMLLFSGALEAQNLLVNGAFDGDINGWFAFSTISWVGDDGAPISGDGSLLNTGSLNNNSSFPAISDKFTVKEQFQYLTGVSFKVPAASPVPWAWYRIHWYDSLDMEIGQSDMVSAVFGVPNDVWLHMTGLLQAPSGAVTGELRVYFQTGDVTDTDVPFGLWDDLYVFEETVFVGGFD